MAAAQSEADQLRQQIAFLTNLINTARNPRGTVPPNVQRFHLPRPRASLNFPHTQFGHGFPRSQTYSNVHVRPTNPSRVRMETSNVRFPLSNTVNQSNRVAGSALFNQNAGMGAPRPVLKANIQQASNRNVIFQNQTRPPTSMTSAGLFRRSDSSQHQPAVQANQTRPVSSANVLGQPLVPSNQAQILHGASLLQQSARLQQQQSSQQNVLNSNFVNLSRHNADLCIQSTQSGINSRSTVTSTSTVNSLQSKNVFSPNTLTLRSSNPFPRPPLIQPPASTVSSPSSSASTAGCQAEEPKMQQMAVLMEELQKTQSKILDLQTQLIESQKGPQAQQQPAVQSNPGQPLSGTALKAYQSATMPSPNQVQSGQGLLPLSLRSPPAQSSQSMTGQGLLTMRSPTNQSHIQNVSGQALLPVRSPLGHTNHSPMQSVRGQGLLSLRPQIPQAAIPGVINTSAASRQPLTQSNNMWVRNPASPGVGAVTNQVVGRPVQALPVGQIQQLHSASLTGPRLVKPRFPGPLVMNTRFQLKRLPPQQPVGAPLRQSSHASARDIQQKIRATQLRNIQTMRMAQFQNFQQSVRVAHYRHVQQSMKAAQISRLQQMTLSRRTSLGNSSQVQGHTSETSVSMTRKSVRGSPMIVSKYKLQRTVRTQVAAQAIVSKYKLQKTTLHGSQNLTANSLRTRYKLQKSNSNFRGRPRYQRGQGRYGYRQVTHQQSYPFYSARGTWRGARHQPRIKARIPKYSGSNRLTEFTDWSFYQSYEHTPQLRRNQWVSSKQRSEMAIKSLLKKRLKLLYKNALPHKSKLKLDRRQKVEESSPSKATRPQSSSTRLVLINGLLYKSSSRSLTKASSSSSQPSTSAASANSSRTSVVVKKMTSAAMKTIKVRGVKFRMDSSGKSLQRIDQNASPSKSASQCKTEVKRVDIGGVTYIQTQPGTLVRSSTTRARVLARQMKSRSIAAATHSLKKDNTKSVNGYCVFYNKFGRCKLGSRCPYKHDPAKVAVCTRFLRGTCKVVGCLFSHKVSKEKMPVCSFFLRGLCVRDNCPYLHVKVNKDAAVCQDFVRGFCPRGERCQLKHTLRCPSFEKSGVCPRGKNCPMLHKRAARKNQRPSKSRYFTKSDKRRTSSSTTSTPSHTTETVDNAADTPDNGVWVHSDPQQDETRIAGKGQDMGAESSHGSVEETVGVLAVEKCDNTTSATSTEVESEKSSSTKVPEKLPSYISLLDVSLSGNTLVEASPNKEGEPLHIKPRL